MAYQTFLQGYVEIPIVTRIYTTACVITTLAVYLDIVTPFQLYFNPKLIIRDFQLWRAVTTFLFFGTAGFSFLFNIIFTYRYCRMLEEGSFRQRSSDFVTMFIFGGCLMIIFAFFVDLLFLGHAFTIMLVYVWSRRNPFTRMNFFGLLNFHAPYLPWVILGFSVILGNSISVDLMGMIVGHIYYFLEDVFPNQREGRRLLRTPHFLKRLFNEHIDLHYEQLAEDRPGGFDWGEQQRNRQEANRNQPQPAVAQQQPEQQQPANEEPAAAANGDNENQLRDRRPLLQNRGVEAN